MYIDMRNPIRVEMHGRIKQKEVWHSGRALGANLLIYVLSGKLTLRIGEANYSGKKGTAFLIPAGVNYAPAEVTELEYLFFHFKTPNADGAAANSPKITANLSLPCGEYAYTYSLDSSPVIFVPTLSDGSENRRAQELADRVTSLNVWTSSSEKLLLDCYLRELLVLLSTGTQKCASRNLRIILQYIENHYSEDLSLSVLSERFGFSRSYIARLFKNELKTHSVDYINRIRVGAACDLLANSDMRISEISERTGFSEQYYFSRIFRQFCGITPTEFRKRNSQT